MSPHLKKLAFHLAWSPDSLPAEDAVSRMLEFLNEQLIGFNQKLVKPNFKRLIQILWEECLLQLQNQTMTNEVRFALYLKNQV